MLGHFAIVCTVEQQKINDKIEIIYNAVYIALQSILSCE